LPCRFKFELSDGKSVTTESSPGGERRESLERREERGERRGVGVRAG